MSVRPILPRISDPNMLPGDGVVDKGGILMNGNQTPAEEEQPGLFTTIYENKMIVIIIILVILIIGICAYVVIRKKDGEEDLGPPPQIPQNDASQATMQQRKGSHDVSNDSLLRKGSTSVVVDSLLRKGSTSVVVDSSQATMQQRNDSTQKEHSPEELQRIMNEMREAKMRRAQQHRQNPTPQQQQNPTPSSQSDEELDQKFNEAITNRDDAAPQERLHATDDTPQDSIIDYMKEAARESPEDFDDKALKIIDEQASLSESVSTVCGAPTQSGGSCRLRPVVDGRCRRHIGV